MEIGIHFKVFSSQLKVLLMFLMIQEIQELFFTFLVGSLITLIQVTGGVGGL